MVGKTVLDQQQESVQAQYLAPLIANGANGQLAVKPAETEVKRELKFQPNMEEEYVQGVQTKNAIWDHVPLTANGANGELAAQPAETEIKIGKLKLEPAMEEDVLELQEETVMSDHALERFLQKVLFLFNS